MQDTNIRASNYRTSANQNRDISALNYGALSQNPGICMTHFLRLHRQLAESIAVGRVQLCTQPFSTTKTDIVRIGISTPNGASCLNKMILPLSFRTEEWRQNPSSAQHVSISKQGLETHENALTGHPPARRGQQNRLSSTSLLGIRFMSTLTTRRLCLPLKPPFVRHSHAKHDQ